MYTHGDAHMPQFKSQGGGFHGGESLRCITSTKVCVSLLNVGLQR